MKNWPMKRAKNTQDSNASVLARIVCPRCGRESTPVMLTYRTYMHSHPDRPGRTCLGSPAEMVFTAMLRDAGLDVRADSAQMYFTEGRDYEADIELNQRQEAYDRVEADGEHRKTTRGGESNGAARA